MRYDLYDSNSLCLECKDYQRACNDGQCVLATQWCDYRIHCRDLSDEMNCTCDSDMVRCDNNICIYKSWECDGDDDCRDLSDERTCGKSSTPAVTHQCGLEGPS